MPKREDVGVEVCVADLLLIAKSAEWEVYCQWSSLVVIEGSWLLVSVSTKDAVNLMHEIFHCNRCLKE